MAAATEPITLPKKYLGFPVELNSSYSDAVTQLGEQKDEAKRLILLGNIKRYTDFYDLFRELQKYNQELVEKIEELAENKKKGVEKEKKVRLDASLDASFNSFIDMFFLSFTMEPFGAVSKKMYEDRKMAKEILNYIVTNIKNNDVTKFNLYDKINKLFSNYLLAASGKFKRLNPEEQKVFLKTYFPKIIVDFYNEQTKKLNDQILQAVQQNISMKTGNLLGATGLLKLPRPDIGATGTAVPGAAAGTAVPVAVPGGGSRKTRKTRKASKAPKASKSSRKTRKASKKPKPSKKSKKTKAPRRRRRKSRKAKH